MPGKVKVKIVAGRNLPVMDRSSDTTDAYVEIKLGNTTYKTDVCRKSLNPQWNSEWYRFEVDDAELQDEPLQIRLMDYDMYSANDAIGKVYIDLNPLLLPMRNHQSGIQPSPCPPTIDLTTFSNSGGGNCTLQNTGGGCCSGGATAATSNCCTQSVLGPGSVFSGWLPVYDTMHGIRGEVNITVKVELFNDFNKFRQSSCGVQFFHSSNIPYGYHARVVHGFVEELVVNDDPEYHWIDKIRTPRASNEARQTLFFKLSGEVQRKIGLKAIEVGANSVIGYHQSFDLEGDSGIVVRGIGTAVTLIRNQDKNDLLETIANIKHDKISDDTNTGQIPIGCNNNNKESQGHYRTESVGSKGTKINATISSIHRRSSDSDLSITPKGNSLSNAERPCLASTIGGSNRGAAPPVKQTNWEMLEFPFITMYTFPPRFIRHIGGTVSARSVKLLERINNVEEPETRDSWWTELRMEIRSHTRALACNVVLGYNEQTSIYDDVCVLSASGTAAVINIENFKDQNELPVFLPRSTAHNPLYEALEKIHKSNTIGSTITTGGICTESTTATIATSGVNNDEYDHQSTMDLLSDHLQQITNSTTLPANCTICHVPYSESSVPYPIVMLKCSVCKHARVPDVLITTIDLPEESPTIGKSCLIQAHVCRSKRDLRAESNAKEISDGLPFLEYDLHRLLINKLKVKGMNSIFGLKVQLSIGERMIIGTASGTGVYLLPLPAPSLPKLVTGVSTSEKSNLIEKQKCLADTAKKNREFYQINTVDEYLLTQVSSAGGVTVAGVGTSGVISASGMDEDNEDSPSLDLTTGNKDSCVLEIDDAEDADIVSLLMESPPPIGFYIANIEQLPGLDEYEFGTHIQMFTQISRAKLPSNQYSLRFGRMFERLLHSVYFKLRRMAPCILCQLRFHVDLPEIDEVQLTAFGTCVGITKSNRLIKDRRKINYQINRDTKKTTGIYESDEIFTLEEDEEHKITSTITPNVIKSPIIRNDLQSFRHGIDITSLSYINGGNIVQYLGNINFFFIRESTSIREGSGLSGFVHSFITEVLAIVRAHITALGGNAMVAYFMNECVLFKNPHKNQGQCLVHVGGDVVFVSYYSETQKTAQN